MCAKILEKIESQIVISQGQKGRRNKRSDYFKPEPPPPQKPPLCFESSDSQISGFPRNLPDLSHPEGPILGYLQGEMPPEAKILRFWSPKIYIYKGKARRRRKILTFLNP